MFLICFGSAARFSVETRVVKTYCLCKTAEMRIMQRQDVFARDHSQEGRQAPPLLEHCGESPCRWRSRGAAARVVSGGDQLFAGTGLAQIDRGLGRQGLGLGTAHVRAVSRRSLPRTTARIIDRALETESVAAASTAAMGRVLVGIDAVADAGFGCVLGRAVARLAQGHALGSGVVRAGSVPAARAWQRVAAAPGVVWPHRACRSTRR